jgi:raffinose/stachyose/melibiose transport system substrate-binding protein
MNKSSSRMRSRLMRTGALALSASLVFAFNTPASSNTKLSGSIEFFHWRGEDTKTFDEIIAGFEKRNPGVKITQVVTSSADHQTTAVSRITGNKKIAVYSVWRDRFASREYLNAGIMEDLTKERFIKNFNAASISTGTLDGKVYAPFYQSLFNMPLYNAEIFAKEGLTPPRTWPGLLRLCKDLKAKGYVPMAWDGAFRPQAMQMINALLANSMPNANTSYGELTASGRVTEPWFFDGVAKKFEEMHKAGCFPDNALGVTQPAADALFASGRAAIRPTGSFSMGSIKTLNPAMAGKMKMMMINSQDSSSKAKFQGIHNTQFGLAVNKLASNGDKAIAKAFIAYLAQPTVAFKYANGSSQHVTVNRVNYKANPDLDNLAVWLTRKTLLAPRFQPQGKAIQAGVEIENMLVQIAGGAKTPAQAAAEYQPIIEQARR